MERSEGSPETTPVRLVSKSRGAVDIALLTFEAQGGAVLRQAEPGAHIELHLPAGVVRQYSLLTPLCTPTRHVVAVKRQADGRGGSSWLHDASSVGDLIGASPPRNLFPLDPETTETVLLAGGIGITPIYSMYERLHALGKPVQMHYWCRSAAHALFLDRWIGAPDVSLHFSGDRNAGGKARRGWKSPSMVIDGLASGADVYCCGPVTMLDEATSTQQARPDVSLHLERFHPAAPPAWDADATGFEVTLARSGKTFHVTPGQTILDVLKDASVDVSYSCEEGVCGACETKLLEGVPIHRDVVYSVADHERRGTIMICCAGSRSKRLVLDL